MLRNLISFEQATAEVKAILTKKNIVKNIAFLDIDTVSSYIDIVKMKKEILISLSAELASFEASGKLHYTGSPRKKRNAVLEEINLHNQLLYYLNEIKRHLKKNTKQEELLVLLNKNESESEDGSLEHKKSAARERVTLEVLQDYEHLMQITKELSKEKEAMEKQIQEQKMALAEHKLLIDSLFSEKQRLQENIMLLETRMREQEIKMEPKQPVPLTPLSIPKRRWSIFSRHSQTPSSLSLGPQVNLSREY